MRSGLSMLVAGVILTLFMVGPSAAQDKKEFYPGTRYSASIPTLRQVVGHEWGEKITLHHEAEAYLNALQQAAGARTRLIKYAESWEGRALYLLIIGSPENIARLDEVGAGIRKLADPRSLTRSEADGLIGTLPAIVWLIYGVHGNEISSTDASLLTAYHLLASRNDQLVEEELYGASASRTFISPDRRSLCLPDRRNNRSADWGQPDRGLSPSYLQRIRPF